MSQVKTHIHQDTYQSPCTLFLDQASTVGWSVWDNTNTLIQSGIVERGVARIEEHGSQLVDFIKDKIDTMDVTTVLYEEVFIPRDGNPGNVAGVERLYYIKHKITDLGYQLPLQVFGLDNGTWKSQLRQGAKKLKGLSDKDEILHYVNEYLPEFESYSEDEVDAIGMGIAVMVNNQGRFYDVSRYNKRLPVHWGIATLDFEGFKADSKMYKRFQEPKDLGGLYEIPLEKSRKIETEFYKLLTHRDVLAYCIIPKSYKYWGFYLLTHNIPIDKLQVSPSVDFRTQNGLLVSEQEDESYILYATRKKRL